MSISCQWPWGCDAEAIACNVWKHSTDDYGHVFCGVHSRQEWVAEGKIVVDRPHSGLLYVENGPAAGGYRPESEFVVTQDVWVHNG
jgi:hypothetical protein